MKKRPPSDYEILRAIHDRHIDEFRNYVMGPGPHGAVAYIPLDLMAFGKQLSIHPSLLFGRLYYNLEPKFRLPASEDGKQAAVSFFAIEDPQGHRYCVNFAILESALAGMWVDRNRSLFATWTSGVSIVIAIAALIVSLEPWKWHW
jgi:hypothetical protein